MGDPFLLSNKKSILASDTPKLPPKVAERLLNLAIETDAFRKGQSLYDPFCGNGTIPLVGRGLFPNHVSKVYGSDLHPEAVDAARINFSCYFPGDKENDPDTNFQVLDACREFMGLVPAETIVVTDPPFGRRCEFKGGGDLESFFRNCGNRGLSKIIFCYDASVAIPRNFGGYKMFSLDARWDRAFYLASKK